MAPGTSAAAEPEEEPEEEPEGAEGTAESLTPEEPATSSGMK
jgi:hypothetical protein